jgi:hypothetical protein
MDTTRRRFMAHLAGGVAAAGLTGCRAQAEPKPPVATGAPEHLKVDLGVGASFHGVRPFPDDNYWNQPIDHLPVDPSSAKLIASIGLDKPLHPDFGAGEWNGAPVGIPYVVVPGTQRGAVVNFEYADESDPGLYPVPDDAPVEGGRNAPQGSDRHVIVIDRDHWRLYELFAAFPDGPSRWRAGSGAIYDLSSNALRPMGWTSADAAGLPIFPGLVRYDEVVEGKALRHAMRFTCRRTRRAVVYPARHWASRDTSDALPPMGMRVRLKRSVNVDRLPGVAKTIAQGLKTYGMILADNGGDWFFTGSPNPRWPDTEIEALKQLKGSDFEVVHMTGLMVG